MLKKRSLCIVAILMFLSGAICSCKIELARADSTIYINADGSISPPSSPISTTDNITYTFAGNISSNSYGIVVERNNTIIDGNGYMLQGSWNKSGIQMTNASNIMIRNTNIESARADIDISFCSNITLANNNLSHAWVGVNFYSSLGNIVSNNIINHTRYGLGVDSSSGNIVSGNSITICEYGIFLQDSSNNTVTQNSFAENFCNVDLQSLYFPPSAAVGNVFFHNNFLGGIYGGPSSLISNDSNLTQVWDNGHEGNYWSDYNGTDSNQDGIGDIPYMIAEENIIDHYPLMGTFQSFNVSSFSPFYPLYDEVDITSNATIGNVFLGVAFDTDSSSIDHLFLQLYDVSGQNGTNSFCRMTFPRGWLNSSIYLWDIQPWENQSSSRIISLNSTSATVYFTFTLPVAGIDLLPEFPTFLVLPLFMIAASLAVMVYKRTQHT